MRVRLTAACSIHPGGKVVLFSTSLTHASVIPPNYLIYAATKGAVEQMMRVLAKDLGARGINVNSVAPGPIDTDLFRKGKTEERIHFFTGLHPQNRLGQPEEVSNVVSFLVSDEASWVSGQTVPVNGVSWFLSSRFPTWLLTPCFAGLLCVTKASVGCR